jgi:hypothetical protein
MRLGHSAGSLIRSALYGSALTALLLLGCGLKPVPIYRAETPISEPGLPAIDRNDFLSELDVYLGSPYKEGGSSLSGIDCSGLARVVYGALGVRLQRTVLEQYGQGVPVRRENTSTGDLLFFGRSPTPSHVGIAISKHQMVHSSLSRGVVVEDIDQFSQTMDLVGIRRVANLR